MATYYIRKTGSDSNNGTSPATAWLTFGKALGASGISSGDTVYVGAGIYREVVTVSMTSATQDTKIIGDVDGSQTGDAGDVLLTAYLNGDKSAPSASNLLSLNAKAFLRFQKISFLAGTGACLSTLNSCNNLSFQDCTFNATTGANAVSILGLPFGLYEALLFDRCIFFSYANAAINITPANAASGSDYNIGVTIQNCLFIGRGIGVQVAAGSGAIKPGSGIIKNCTFFANSTAVNLTGNYSQLQPLELYNSVFLGCQNGVSAGSVLQIREDWNTFQLTITARTNTNAGANSVAGNNTAALYEAGQSYLFGRLDRPAFSPLSYSPTLGFGNVPGTTVAYDFTNRPRPSGGTAANYSPGAFEFHDNAIQELTITDSGPGLKIIGPGDHDFTIPVGSVSTTITIKGRYDNAYGTLTSLPMAMVTNATEVGYGGGTYTMTSPAGTWETMSIGPFTPNAKGVVTLRVQSVDSSGKGTAFFDTATGGQDGSQGFDYFRRNEPMPSAVESALGRLLINRGMNGV